MVSDNKTLDKVYTAKSSSELMAAYKDWAVDYESDTVGKFGYVAHIESARALDRALSQASVRKDCKILDAGCGTGLVGVELSKMGYQQIEALDYSIEMLEEASTKNIYRMLMQADLNAPLDIPENTYDAVVCTGTFTYGHVKPEALVELRKITRPDGVICFTIREGAFEDYNYRHQMIDMERDNMWELLEMQDVDYLKNEGVTCKMCTYRVTQ